MPAQAQYYLTCSGCGNVAIYEDKQTILGETEECVRDECADEGWLINQGSDEKLDYCSNCKITK
jgi:hypothetical protein